ncbi:MAG: hypothetical protein ACI9U2_000417 [Bradymonadia bacterium]|jgi:hypothetical protein
MRASITLGLMAFFILCTTGCDDDFDPRNLLAGYRVMGIEADRPEPAPDDVVRLTAHDFDTDGLAPTYEWTLCLYSFGSAADYACVDPALQFAIGDTRELAVDLGPDGIDLRARFEAAGDVYDAQGNRVTLEDGHIVYVELNSGVPGGRQIRTIKRLFVHDTTDARNTNPVIEAFEVEGDPIGGTKVTVSVTVEGGALETYQNTAGETVAEELLYTWYTTAGEYDPGLTFADDTDTRLKLPKAAGPIDVWVAVRDGRGGLAIERRTISVE